MAICWIDTIRGLLLCVAVVNLGLFCGILASLGLAMRSDLLLMTIL